MKNRDRIITKSYAMGRMGKAIERAIEATTILEKERAARWAAAWGVLCDIKTKRVRLKPDTAVQRPEPHELDDDLPEINFPEIVFTVHTQNSSRASASEMS